MRVTIEPIHVRAALQSAAGQGLKAPSIAFEEYVASYLSRINYEETTFNAEPNRVPSPSSGDAQ